MEKRLVTNVLTSSHDFATCGGTASTLEISGRISSANPHLRRNVRLLKSCIQNVHNTKRFTYWLLKITLHWYILISSSKFQFYYTEGKLNIEKILSLTYYIKLTATGFPDLEACCSCIFFFCCLTALLYFSGLVNALGKPGNLFKSLLSWH